MPAELAAPSLAARLKLAEARAREAKLRGVAGSAAIEAQGWEAWLRHYFGSYFSRPFTAYQKSFWADWAWTIQPDMYYRPRVECEPRGVGKCLAGDTEVLLADGTRITIADVVVGDRVLSFNRESGQFEPDTIKFKWSSGQKACLRIRTKTGKSLVLTPEHQVLTFEGWKRAVDLTLNDRLALPRYTPIPTSDDCQSSAVRLTAYMIAEGAVSSLNCNFTNTDEVLVEDFTSCVKALGGGVVRRVRHRYDLVGRGRAICRELGVWGKRATEKRLPLWVYRLSESQKWEFLAAFIDTDGWISKHGRLGITLANRELISDLQYLFLQVGVASFVIHKPRKTTNAHELIVDQGALQRCADRMPLRLKGDRLRRVLQKRRYSLLDSYPHSIVERRGLCGVARRSRSTRIDSPYDVTRGKLQKMIALSPEPDWLWLENAQVFWDKLVAVEEFGDYETYDVEVARNHNLLTNGIVSHNSTNAEAAVVSWIARQRRSMIGYVSLDEQKAEQHFNTIKTMLESESLVGDYPHCKPAVQKVRSMATQWSREAIVTGSNAMIVPITLRGSRRGWKSSTGKRFDALILDDIDELGMSPGFQRKMLELLKSEILAAGDDNTLILMPENLIHRDSICARILDHRADILSDRIFCGPYPLLKWYDAEKTELDDGSRRWKIISGEAFDEAIPIPYAEKLLNKYGKATFDRECQQEVAKVEDDKDFREYDEMYHVITWSEFEAYFSQFKYELRHPATGKRKLPDRWHKGKGLDWGTTSGHPAACIFVTRPDQNSPLSDCHFVFGEVILPRYPLDVTEDIEVVSPGRVARAIRLFQEQWGLAENSFEQALMSHEASAALNTFRVDLTDDIKVEFAKWKAQKGSGVPQIQNVLEIDYSKPHPFRRHPQTGEPLKGRPRKYLIVDDDQGALFVDDVGKLRVQGAKDSLGLARLRYEIPLYQHTVSAKDKKDDDAVDAWRGLMSRFGVTSDALSREEKIQSAIPEPYRIENLLASSTDGKLTPEAELAYVFQRHLAQKKTQPRAKRWDDYGRLITD